ncbi:gephyrin-like molybdotransferase Glp [Nocardioides sp. CFH 31398]|uniref:molybdotransferase-like divisome protein Glp n=1 Tax=Nocardioides sp. CFH 31398 TaxID=2919579 RepID=UPI0023D9D4F7|nr:gephyrin-like molybdotransferase Glp [Nocardioides sp. CFH 31398]
MTASPLAGSTGPTSGPEGSEGGEPITVEQLREHVLATVRPLPAHAQPLMEALGLPVAEDVHSTLALPGFDNSAMDGYAVVQRDVATASDESPVHLPVIGEIGAGQARLTQLAEGTAAKIMTGAPVPAGADAIVPYEWTDRGEASVWISKAPEPGQHVRLRGDDIAEGDLLVEAGTVLTPRHLGLLAAVGRDRVRCRQRPRVVVLSTGSELRDAGQELGHDSIYDGNSFLLAAAARAAGAIAYRVGIVPDDPARFTEALADQLVRADVVVTSGGVSMGDFDVVKEALRDLDTMWFGPVAMQPGKPQGFGTIGEDATPIFTLPGNPVSSYLSFEVFVLPALRRMMGLTPEVRPSVRARVTHSVSSPPGRRQFLRGSYDEDAGTAYVTPIGGSGSHLLGNLAISDALIVVPEDTTALEAGETVEVIRMDVPF